MTRDEMVEAAVRASMSCRTMKTILGMAERLSGDDECLLCALERYPGCFGAVYGTFARMQRQQQ
jgi:hypothetical protein